jgi:hypothetical protein
MTVNLHDLVPDEATIKILSNKTGVLNMAPPHLRKNYWVCLGEGANYDASFDSLEEAISFIKQEAARIKQQEMLQELKNGGRG